MAWNRCAYKEVNECVCGIMKELYIEFRRMTLFGLLGF